MYKNIQSLSIAFLAIIMTSVFIICSCSNNSSKDTENENLSEVVASGNFNEMMNQIDHAVSKGNFNFAFKVLSKLPTYFNENSKFWYDPKTGEIKEYEWGMTEYDFSRYCRKAIEVLKAESDILLSKDDPEAENLFLEHLADFDLGVYKVNLGEYGISESTMFINPNRDYKEAVTIYNDYLISVIRKAAIKNKLDLAKKLSLLIRDGLSYTKIPNKPNTGFWAYDTEAKDEAKEIIDKFSAL